MDNTTFFEETNPETPANLEETNPRTRKPRQSVQTAPSFSLSPYQKFKFDLFKAIFDVAKNTNATYALVADVENWLQIKKPDPVKEPVAPFSITDTQKFQLELFKLIYPVAKNTTSTYALVSETEKWLQVKHD
jgi:hypothetical protein